VVSKQSHRVMEDGEGGGLVNEYDSGQYYMLYYSFVYINRST
jgi:hypothetical protein